MGSENPYVLGAVLVGLGATLISDVWALFLRRVFNVSAPNFCFVGRWFRYMPTGRFTHANIAESPGKPAECATGWFVHYVVGIVFALMLVTPASGRWLNNPSLLPALLIGLGTVVFPFLVMQPSFGLGIAASNSANPTRARLKSLMAHAVFGVGLYLSALPVHFLLYVNA